MIAVPIDNGQRRVLVASPDYLARCGVPATPDDLPAHHCLRYRFPGSGKLEPWYFSLGDDERALDVSGSLIFNEDRLIKDAALAGLGIAQRFQGTVLQELAQGQLVEVLPGYASEASGFSSTFPPASICRSSCAPLSISCASGVNGSTGGRAPAGAPDRQRFSSAWMMW